MLTSLFPWGCVCPSRNGTNGCIPAVVKRTVGSFSGTRDEFLILAWPFEVKNSMYFFISSFLSILSLRKISF